MVTVSILVLFTLGFVAAALLGISSKILAVEEDPRVEAVVEVLPGANCGGCGFAGCENYAQAVVSDPDVPAGLCVAGGEETSIKVGNLTGKIVAAMEPRPPCSGPDREPISAHSPASATETASRYAPSTPCICATDSSGSIRRAVPDAASAPGHAPATFWRSFPAVPA